MNAVATEEPRIHTLCVLLTGRCNLHCAYCYRGGSGGRDLAADALDAALTMALRAEGPTLEVIFSGGEPALRFDVFRSAVARLRAGASASRPVAVRLATNGTLLSDDRLDFLVEQGVYLSLSLDGAPPAQRLRGALAVSRLDQLLERLRLGHPGFLAHRVRAVMTVLPETVSHLAASVDHLLDAGVAEIRAAPVLTPVAGWDDDLRAELATQLTAVRRRCEERLAATGKVPFLPLRHYGIETAPGGPGPDQAGVRSCAITSGAAPVLDTDGRLYACLMFAPSGLGAGPEQRSLRRVAATVDLGRPGERGYAERAARLPTTLAAASGFAPGERLSSRFGACADCVARSSCRICPYALLRFGGDHGGIRVPAFLCAFHQEMTRQRALIPAQKPTAPERWRPEVLEERRQRFLEKFGRVD